MHKVLCACQIWEKRFSFEDANLPLDFYCQALSRAYTPNFSFKSNFLKFKPTSILNKAFFKINCPCGNCFFFFFLYHMNLNTFKSSSLGTCGECETHPQNGLGDAFREAVMYEKVY